MSEGNDNFWDPYCPCKVTRKNVVMTILAILCFALVIWTIIATSYEVKDANVGLNGTVVKVKSDKPLDEFNFVVSANMMVKKSGEEMTKSEKERRKMTDAIEKYETYIENLKVIDRTLFVDGVNGTKEPICKCICNITTTLEDAMDSIEYMISTLHEDVQEMRRIDKKCYPTVTWDENPWTCEEEPPIEPTTEQEESAR